MAVPRSGAGPNGSNNAAKPQPTVVVRREPVPRFRVDLSQGNNAPRQDAYHPRSGGAERTVSLMDACVNATLQALETEIEALLESGKKTAVVDVSFQFDRQQAGPIATKNLLDKGCRALASSFVAQGMEVTYHIRIPPGADAGTYLKEGLKITHRVN